MGNEASRLGGIDNLRREHNRSISNFLAAGRNYDEGHSSGADLDATINSILVTYPSNDKLPGLLQWARTVLRTKQQVEQQFQQVQRRATNAEQ